MTTFEVFDNGKKAEGQGWNHPVCTDFESAINYAKNWLGEALVCGLPDQPNQIVDYNGHGDTIVIHEINFD